MYNTSFIVVAALLFSLSTSAQQNHTLKSPDGKIQVSINLDGKIQYSVNHEADVVIMPSAISMKLSNNRHVGLIPQLKNVKRNSANQTINAMFYKRSIINDHYNELILNFKDDFSLVFRVYNEGVAYRFIT